jgi:two-component system, LytTR family, sensor histidine kinase AlgZ
MTPKARYILRMAAVNVTAAIFVLFAFTGVRLDTPWRSAAPMAAVALLFSMCIGTPCAIVIPRVSPTLWRLRFPFNWVALAAVIYGIAIVGGVVAISILVLVGYVAPGDFVEWVLGSTKYAVITTLIFGLTISAYEMMRARLEQATLELRTKQRDEAEARRVAVEAQLASLESRVQPHFLFNTLNSIASLIHDDPKGAEKMTQQLASLLRSALDAGASPLVALEQELKTVRDYLDIEQVRFGERLHYDIRADESVKGVLIPRLSLQTLAENAVKYAVSARREGGAIAVRASENGSGKVRLEVEDNGAGFDATALPEHHGLALLRSRLALTFGDRATFAIHSAPGGTLVAIEVPRSG